jgi:hypothetical protein
VNQRKAAGNLPHLVPLQRADEVPFHRHGRRVRLLGERLLHPVFAHGVETLAHRGAYGISPEGLGDGNNTDRLPPAPARLADSDFLPHHAEAFAQGLEIHSLVI